MQYRFCTHLRWGVETEFGVSEILIELWVAEILLEIHIAENSSKQLLRIDMALETWPTRLTGTRLPPRSRTRTAKASGGAELIIGFALAFIRKNL